MNTIDKSVESRVEEGAIHHFCKTFFPIRGGVEVVVAKICELLYGRFESKIVSTSGCSKSERDLKISEYKHANVRLVPSFGDFLSLPMAPGVLIEAFFSLRRAKHIVIHYPFPLLDLAVFLFWPFARSSITVYWHSNIVAQKISRYLVFPLTYVMLWQARNIVVATPPMLEHSWLLRKFRSKVTVIPYGLWCAERDSDVSEVCRGYIIAIGRHVEYKGFDVLLHALAATNIGLVIVGNGPLLEKHKRLAAELGISHRVEFLTDVSDSQKMTALNESMGMVLPSVYPSEAFALVQLEAMELRKPIINTALESGVPWVARDGLEAITVPPADVAALANAINTLVGDAKLRDELGRGGRLRVEQEFSEVLFRDRLIRLILN